MICLEVAVAAPLDSTLTYSLGDGQHPADHPESPCRYTGRRVLVPLGGRRLTGYVLGSSPPPERKTEYTLRSVIKFLDDEPVFQPEMLPFFRWVANYYHHPLGLVIKAALPGGLAPRSIRKIALKGTVKQLHQQFLSKTPSWIQELADKKTLSQSRSAQLLKDSSSARVLKKLSSEGLITFAQTLQKDSLGEKKERCFGVAEKISLPEITLMSTPEGISHEGLDECRQKIALATGLSPRCTEVKALCFLQHLSSTTESATVALKDLRKLYPGIAKPLASLVRLDLVRESQQRVYRSPFGEQLPFYPRPAELTCQQNEVLEEILPAITSKSFVPFLLHGITGCGKTEVYLRAAEKTLECGRDVLILVPEIALATQLEAQLLSRFTDKVVLLHSGLSAAQRYDQYHLALSGKAKVVIGARSAVFAPLRDPGTGDC
jgi:primosomal protein N' (replication factor Y)